MIISSNAVRSSTELKRILEESSILKESDEQWPEPDVIGRQELEIRVGDKTCCLATSKIGSLVTYNQVTTQMD